MSTGMSGSAEFTTWIVLAFAAILAGIVWIFSSSLFALIPAALIGAGFGFVANRLFWKAVGQKEAGRRPTPR